MNTNSRAGSPSLLRRATTGGVAPSSTPPVTLIHQRQMSGPSRVGTARGFSIQALAAREDAQDWPAFRRAGLFHRHCFMTSLTCPRPRAGGLFRAGGRGCTPAHAIHFNAADHVSQNLVQPLPATYRCLPGFAARTWICASALCRSLRTKSRERRPRMLIWRIWKLVFAFWLRKSKRGRRR